MRSSLKLLLAPLFFLGVALSLFLKGHLGTAPVSTQPADRTPTSVEKKATEENQRQSYRYFFERKLNSNLVKFEYSGIFQVDLLEKSVGHETWAIGFILLPEGSAQTYTSRKTVLLETNGQGDLFAIKTQKVKSRDDAEELNIIKDFISIFAYRSDRDTTGRYRAKWKDLDDGGEKTKVEYLGATGESIKVLKSFHRVKLDTEDFIVRVIEGKDVLSLGGKDELTSSYKLMREVNGFSSDTPVLVLSSDEWVNTSLGLETVSRELDARPYEELAVELKDLKKLNRSKRLSFFHDLVRSLKSDPTKIATFKKEVEVLREQTGMMTFAVGVLATVGSEEAQGALVSWFNEYQANDSALGHTILNAFSTADAALTDQTRHFLLKLTENQNTDLSQNAAFALGAGLKHSNDSSARDKLLSLFHSARDDLARANIVDAMGNSGDGNFLPVLLDALKSTSKPVREKAAFASRFMATEHAQVLIREAMRDRQASVRISATKACAVRGDPSCKKTLR